MKPLVKLIAIAILVISVLSFNSKEHKLSKNSIKLESVNIDNLLSKQQFECRPSSDFIFDVETRIIKKIRGANSIRAKVFIVDRTTGRKRLLAQENIQVKNHRDAIFFEDHSSKNTNTKITKLINGDKIIGNQKNNPYQFQELIQYDFIYNKYLNATNKLLDLKRSI